MERIDLKKDLKHLYRPSAKEIVQVDVPPLNYLMVDGAGDPNTSKEFFDAVEALFMVAYAIKFMIKQGASAIDYGVMPLEGLWWTGDMAKFSITDKSAWQWTAMIMQPSWVAPELVAQAIADVRRRRNPPAISRLRLESLAEGLCAQILYVGPFAEEGPVIERLHQFIDSRGRRTGKHHEVYLSDMRRTDPSKWKTILRQPMC